VKLNDNQPIVGPKGLPVGVAALVVLVIVAAAVVSWHIYNRPAHPYDVHRNSATWIADVTLVRAEINSNSAVLPVGSLRDIPGVGKIVKILVNRTPSGKGLSIEFLTAFGVGSNATGLVYLNDHGPPWDMCVVHLRGVWWQLGPLDVDGTTCARGFHFTPGG
jgi:hypothetical protein